MLRQKLQRIMQWFQVLYLDMGSIILAIKNRLPISVEQFQSNLYSFIF